MQYLRFVSLPAKSRYTAPLAATALLLPLILGVGSLWRDAPQVGPAAALPSFTISAGLA